jgi:hypothetical protein
MPILTGVLVVVKPETDSNERKAAKMRERTKDLMVDNRQWQ